MKASTAWMLILTAPLAGCRACQGDGTTSSKPEPVVITREQLSEDTTRPPPGVVNVVLNCATHPPGGSVTPYRLRVGVHDSVAWNFAGADTFRVVPTPPPSWPFANAEPTGSPGHPATSGPVTTPPAPGDSLIRYTIHTACERTPITIDPEIIIIPD